MCLIGRVLWLRVYTILKRLARISTMHDLIRGIGQHIRDPPEVTLNADTESLSQIVGYPVLGGLHHDYQRAV